MPIKVLELEDYSKTLIVIAFYHHVIWDDHTSLRDKICNSVSVVRGDINWVYLNRDGSFRQMVETNDQDAEIIQRETILCSPVYKGNIRDHQESDKYLPKDYQLSPEEPYKLIDGDFAGITIADDNYDESL